MCPYTTLAKRYTIQKIPIRRNYGTNYHLNLDENIKYRLQKQAEEHGRSLEEEAQ